MLVYATTADLTAWPIEPLPTNADRLIRAASNLVREATMTDVYATDADGLPTDTAIADAMRDAVCAQVENWVALGVDPVAGPAGTGGVVTSTQLLSGSVQYATYAKQAEDRAAATTTLCADAVLELTAVGLTTTQPAGY